MKSAMKSAATNSTVFKSYVVKSEKFLTNLRKIAIRICKFDDIYTWRSFKFSVLSQFLPNILQLTIKINDFGVSIGKKINQ
jgi:hypothetical protein